MRSTAAFFHPAVGAITAGLHAEYSLRPGLPFRAWAFRYNMHYGACPPRPRPPAAPRFAHSCAGLDSGGRPAWLDACRVLSFLCEQGYDLSASPRHPPPHTPRAGFSPSPAGPYRIGFACGLASTSTFAIISSNCSRVNVADRFIAVAPAAATARRRDSVIDTFL